MSNFYEITLKKAGIAKDDAVLAVCGGRYDQECLLEQGVTAAVISNLSHHAGVADYAPYSWEYQDAEKLTSKNESFDWVVVSCGLHHCASPHQAFCEMLRVARKGIVVVESRDSFLLNLGKRFGITSDFELEPAIISNGEHGGYRNTAIPNYVYRWTEREIEKTVKSFRPDRLNEIEFNYGWRLPIQRLSMSRSRLKRLSIGILGFAVRALEFALPRQGNNFGIIVRKCSELQPWLKENDGVAELNLEYASRLYDPEKYRRAA